MSTVELTRLNGELLFAAVGQCSKTIQSTISAYGGGYDYDQSWICVL